MEETLQTLLRAGGHSQIVEDFRAVQEATAPDGGPRHAPYPTMQWLARFVVGQAGGPHKDAPLYELCHLLAALTLATPSPDVRALFFLSPDRVTAPYAREWFQSQSVISGLEITKEEIALTADGQRFGIRYGRMPNLAALYEFLCGMEEFGFYAKFEEICSTLTNAPTSLSAIKSATGALSAELRQYRRRYVDSAKHEGKFGDILNFLRQDETETTLSIDDAAILDFWNLHKQGKDYKGYRTVFDLFVTFSEALSEATSRSAVNAAAPLGTDRANGEVDAANEDAVGMPVSQWASPLEVFAQPPLNEINFFKKSSERKPLDALMRYGPYAARLPLAFLRYEVFGQVQSGITNDLQVGRGAASIVARINCTDAEPYPEKQDQWSSLREHCQTLQEAALHAIMPNEPSEDSRNVVAFTRAAQAFKKTNRRGFEPFDGSQNDMARRAAFRIAAEALVTMTRALDAVLAQLEQMNSTETPLDTQFTADRPVFAAAFTQLYGDRA